MPCVVCRQGWGGLLAGESGLSGPLSLLGFRERNRTGLTTPWRGCSWGGKGGYMALGGGLGAQEPVADWVHCSL